MHPHVKKKWLCQVKFGGLGLSKDIEYVDIVIGELLLSIQVTNKVLGYCLIRSSMVKEGDGVTGWGIGGVVI